jgi:hypothetical protein
LSSEVCLFLYNFFPCCVSILSSPFIAHTFPRYLLYVALPPWRLCDFFILLRVWQSDEAFYGLFQLRFYLLCAFLLFLFSFSYFPTFRAVQGQNGNTAQAKQTPVPEKGFSRSFAPAFLTTRANEQTTEYGWSLRGVFFTISLPLIYYLFFYFLFSIFLCLLCLLLDQLFIHFSTHFGLRIEVMWSGLGPRCTTTIEPKAQTKAHTPTRLKPCEEDHRAMRHCDSAPCSVDPALYLCIVSRGETESVEHLRRDKSNRGWMGACKTMRRHIGFQIDTNKSQVALIGGDVKGNYAVFYSIFWCSPSYSALLPVQFSLQKKRQQKRRTKIWTLVFGESGRTKREKKKKKWLLKEDQGGTPKKVFLAAFFAFATLLFLCLFMWHLLVYLFYICACVLFSHVCSICIG